jgi:hypothetical protein
LAALKKEQLEGIKSGDKVMTMNEFMDLKKSKTPMSAPRPAMSKKKLDSLSQMQQKLLKA